MCAQSSLTLDATFCGYITFDEPLVVCHNFRVSVTSVYSHKPRGPEV